MSRKLAFEMSFRKWLDANMPAVDGHDPVGFARQIFDAVAGGCSWPMVKEVVERVINEAKRGE